MGLNRIKICDVPLDCVDMTSAIDYLDAVIHNNNKCSVFAINPEKVIFANQNKEIKEILSSAGLLIPDGIGVVLAAKLQGAMFNPSVLACPNSSLHNIKLNVSVVLGVSCICYVYCR